MKKLLAIVLTLVMVLGLAACGGTATDESPASSEVSVPAESEAESEDDTEAPVEPEGKSLSGTLVYWSMWQEVEPQAEALKAAIARFEEANPEVTVEVEWQGRGIKDLIIPAVVSGQQIDLFDSDPNNIYKSDPDILLDLTEFYESEALDGGAEKDNVMKGLVDLDKSLSVEFADGNYHSVFYAPYAITWFYNRDMFTAAGITDLPQTWEELGEVCAKLKEAGSVPIVSDDAYMTMVFSYYLEKAIGEEAIKEMVTQGGEAYNNPMLLQALEAMEDFATKGYFSPQIKTNNFPAGQQQFAREEAAMYFNASFMAAENSETARDDFPYGHFAFPAVPGGVGTITENTVGGQAFMVNADTQQKDAVFELLHHFTSIATQEDFLNSGLVPSTNVVDWPADVAEQKEIVASLTRNINWGASFDGDFVGAVVSPQITAVMFGETTAQQAFDTIIAESAKFN